MTLEIEGHLLTFDRHFERIPDLSLTRLEPDLDAAK